MPLPVLIMWLHRALNYELTFLRNARYIAICCVCLKSKTLCIYRFSPSSSPRLLQNIGEFGGKKNLQTIPGLIILYLIKYTLSEIHFWSVKCTTVTLRKNLEQHSIPFKWCRRLQWVDENKPLQKAFKRI